MPQPKSHLLEILVTVNPNGTFGTTVLSYFDSKPVNGPLHVNVGDQVGWLVKVMLPGGRKSLPYTIGFSDESFFGATSLDVPKGGTSQFLSVRREQGSVSYSLNVTGVGCVFDPEIQSGVNGFIMHGLALTSYEVTWDTAANTMAYAITGNSPSPFPPGGVKLKRGDDVTFLAAGTSGTVTAFTIQFAANNNLWLTPFEPNDQNLDKPKPAPTTIGSVTVTDPGDAGHAFPFTASLKQNGTPIAFPGDPNVQFTL